MSNGDRPPGRIPMPDLEQVRTDANLALGRSGLPACTMVEPVADGDTMNPQVVGYTDGPRYVIKVVYPHATTWHGKDLGTAARIANELRKRTRLPIPEHYCILEEQGRLPLVVMEFLAGEQLRLALRRTPEAQCRALCGAWGRCIGQFHDPSLIAFLDNPAAADLKPSYDSALARAYLAQHDGSDWHRRNARRIVDYLEARLPLTGRFEIPALTKHGMDVRDFLAAMDPEARISGMLDWEGVGADDALTTLVATWTRLHCLGVGHAAASFLEAYERERGLCLCQSSRTEFHLMNRALLPTSHSPAARAIVEGLLDGAEYPFNRRVCECGYA
jgi:hypothetical protein